VLVPVSGVLSERLDPALLEATWRATAAERGEPVDEAWLQEVLARVRTGPIELNLDQNVGAVQVMRIDGAWLICEPLPSSAPAARPDVRESARYSPGESSAGFVPDQSRWKISSRR
jgi:hypothetical protein